MTRFLQIIYIILSIYYYYLFSVILLGMFPSIAKKKWYLSIKKGADWFLYGLRGKIVIREVDFTGVIAIFLYALALRCLKFLIQTI